MELALSTPVSHPPLLAPSSQTVASLFRVIHEQLMSDKSEQA